jgi:pyruvate formate lyase activating enzyme
MIFSVGGWGCNLRCGFCQNWTISQQALGESGEVSPEDVVSAASSNDSVGVAYTYNEPLVGFEFVRDCAALARRRGMKNVLVTNGYICPRPAAELLPRIDALNIDVKSMRDSFYSDHCGGTLQPVLDFCVQAKAAGCHVEITNLVIPGLNDSDDEASDLAGWISSNLGPLTPLHLSAYHPEYKMSAPPTPAAALERRRMLCLGSLRHVYVGNVISSGGANTVCMKCGGALIRRRGYSVDVSGLNGDRCRACGTDCGIVVR